MTPATGGAPDAPLLIGDLLRRQARPDGHPRKPALVFGEAALTFAELNASANRLANALQARGLRHGDRVAVLGRNCLEYVVVYFGLAKSGAIMVPVNFWYKAEEIRYTLEQSGSRMVLLDQAFGPTVAPLRTLPGVERWIAWGRGRLAAAEHLDDLLAGASDAEPQPDRPLREEDPHIILYTSGTTGFPKGAVLTHRNHVLHALITALVLGNRDDDVGPIVYPLFHTGGPDCLLLPHVAVGATCVVFDGADPKTVLAGVERYRLTSIFCVPTVWRRLLAELDRGRYDVSSVRRGVGSSDTFPVELLDAILERFPPGMQLYVAYGLTEASPWITFARWSRDQRAKIGSVGRSHALAEVRIVDAEGRDVPDGEVGELITRGPLVMQGYWRMPDKTAEAIRDGWLHTGDLARRDADGDIFLMGRAKDMLISGGENIYPAEIERVIRDLAGVRDVAVVGVPDPEWGESVLAVVVPEPGSGLTEAAVIAHVRGRLAGYKKPRFVEFVETLPVTTATGKVQKAVLRERYRDIVARRGGGGS